MIETDIKIYDRISAGIGCPGFRRDCVEGTKASLVARGAARQQSNTSPSAELACPMIKDKVREDK
jgi:hypothetical protein